MINKNFIKDTDQVIEKLAVRGIKFEHGNVLVAKVKVDRVTSAGIHIADDYADREEYKSGFARILALPSDYEGPLKIGQYVMFSHEGRYKLYLSSIREVLGLEVIDNFLYTVQDNNIILTIDQEILHEKLNSSITAS